VTVPGGRQEGSDSFSVEPGETQAVRVHIETRHIRTREPYEKNNILIETNDPENSLVRLTMKLQVMDVLQIMPAEINFGSVKPGSVNTRVVTITNKTPERIILTKITATPESALETSLQGGNTLDPGKSVTVSVTFRPSASMKSFYGIFLIETNLETLKAKSIQVRAAVSDIPINSKAMGVHAKIWNLPPTRDSHPLAELKPLLINQY